MKTYEIYVQVEENSFNDEMTDIVKEFTAKGNSVIEVIQENQAYIDQLGGEVISVDLKDELCPSQEEMNSCFRSRIEKVKEEIEGGTLKPPFTYLAGYIDAGYENEEIDEETRDELYVEYAG